MTLHQRHLRAAMTQTRNAYAPMPPSVERLGELAGRLEDLRAANVAHHLELIADAAAHGVQVIGLGELFTAPYFALHEDQLWFGLAEDSAQGPTVGALRAAAEQHQIAIVAPIFELDAKSGRRFNTAVVIEESGELLGTYRKTHIPEGSNERGSFHETFYYDRSDGEMTSGPSNISRNPFFPVFETDAGRIGIATCYDRHFEGVVRTLAANGAQLVFSPAVTFGAHSRRMWELEFQVDAARHNLFVGGSNRMGSEPPFDVEYFGGSFFCGPRGRVEPIESRPELVIADLDLAELDAGNGSGWDLTRDARPDIYS